MTIKRLWSWPVCVITTVALFAVASAANAQEFVGGETVLASKYWQV